jgi:hypothetical protein
MNYRKLAYLLFGLSLLGIRLFFNYITALIPGINGGYYPLQVRALLETGRLAFPDMPLYFYLNAACVKLLSLFTHVDQDTLILHISKILDSVSLPLLVIPLYLFARSFTGGSRLTITEILVLAFCTLSFSPLMLTSDLQKNAFAMPWMLFFMHYLFRYVVTRKRKHIVAAILFLLLTGLSHFGVFAISVFMFLISLMVLFRKKAVLPVLGAALAGFLFIFLFDRHRVDTLCWLWIIIFRHQALLQGPLSIVDYFNFVFTWFLVGIGIYYLVRRRDLLSTSQRQFLSILVPVLFFLSFPFFNLEFVKRFTLMLFIPQVAFLLILSDTPGRIHRIIIMTVLALTVVGSLGLLSGNIKQPSITREAYEDLLNLKIHITDPGETLIIARHGLEWWTAWQLGTKIGQEKSLDDDAFDKYKLIVNLVQTDGINPVQMRRQSPFQEPGFQTPREPFYVSDYFRAIALVEGELSPCAAD